MQEKPNRRKERVPLTPEELHYFKKLKKLKEIQYIERFKSTRFYNVINYFNIFLIAVVTYFFISILTLTQWQTHRISNLEVVYGEFNREVQQRDVSEIHLILENNERLVIKTRYLFQLPVVGAQLFVGKDWLFSKPLKVKLNYDDRSFWETKTYPSVVLCAFALLMTLYVYRVNQHLTSNGLLTSFGLLSIASLYFLFV